MNLCDYWNDYGEVKKMALPLQLAGAFREFQDHLQELLEDSGLPGLPTGVALARLQGAVEQYVERYQIGTLEEGPFTPPSDTSPTWPVDPEQGAWEITWKRK